MNRLLTEPGRGWRSDAPWACLCQLQMRSTASKLRSGVQTRPPALSQESSSKGGQGFCGALSGGERPRRASPGTTLQQYLGEIKISSEGGRLLGSIVSGSASDRHGFLLLKHMERSF